MSDKRKLYLVILILITYAALSVFFWYVGNHWYYGLIPTVIAGVIEIYLRSKRKPQQPKKELSYTELNQERDSTIPHTSEATTNYTGITSINILILKDFISLCADNNLSVLGTGTPEQLQTAFNDILSQYYQVRKDTGVDKTKNLLREIALLELHQVEINILAVIMQERYSYAGAKILNKHYPLFTFSRETYLKDLAAIGNLEIKSNIKIERLRKQLAALEQSQQVKQTPEQIRIGFISRLADISKVESIKYDTNMTVFEYAVMENRLIEHIENLQKQANAQR